MATAAEDDLIDLELIDLGSDHNWLYKSENSSSEEPGLEIDFYLNVHKRADNSAEEFSDKFNEILTGASGGTKKHFDSRTYTRPKKKPINRLDNNSQAFDSFNLSGTKTFTRYSKSPRNTEGDHSYDGASNHFNDGPMNRTYSSNLNETFDINTHDFSGEDASVDYNTIGSRPINIKLSEPANNMHNTFNNRFLVSNHQHDSFSNISPPSLVSSIAMDGSGTFNSLSFSRQGSVSSKRGVACESSENHNDNTVFNSMCSSMTVSILDEKDMNTSFLSHAGHSDNESFIATLPPNMMDSIDPNLTASLMNASSNRLLLSHKGMDDSMVNSATFNMADSTDENYMDGNRRFHLRRSFLKVDPGDQDAINEYLKNNSTCNTLDLQDLASDLIMAAGKRDVHNATYKTEHRHSGDDEMLLNDGLSDSFVKLTGRESLNMTFNKSSSPLSKTRENVVDVDETNLPNQVSTPPSNNSNLLALRKPTGDTPKSVPKRNNTFKVTTPSNYILNSDNGMVDIVKPPYEDIDSNKESYNINDVNNRNNIMEMKQALERKKTFEIRTMAGSSSDSLECSTNSELSPPRPTTVPLNLADLEYLAYQQHQSLFQDISTPMPKSKTDKRDVFQSDDFSPIKSHSRDTLSSSTSSNKSSSPLDPQKYGTYRVNSSSTGNINKMMMRNDGFKSPKHLSSVKRESSAPEIMEPGKKNVLKPRTALKRDEYESNSGMRLPKSVGSSPLKSSYGAKPNNQPLYNRSLYKLQQNSGSTNELRQTRSGLPASKLRQYSSHRELNRISVVNDMRNTGKTDFHSSNPLLYPLTRQGSYTISAKGENYTTKLTPREVTKIAPTKVTNSPMNRLSAQYGQPVKARHNVASYTAPNKDSAIQGLVSNNQPVAKVPTQQSSNTNTQTNSTSKVAHPAAQTVLTSGQRLVRPSGLPRPSSGIPRKPALRPPSTYSLAPRQNDQADCY